jgi:hypothetical protein
VEDAPLAAIDPKKLYEQVSGKKNVTGFSGKLVKKIKDGRETRGWAFRVYVVKKVKDPDEMVALRESGDFIPEMIDGVPTDVEEVGELRALDLDPKDFYRPAPAGVSAIAANKTACTLGWFARDNQDGKLVIIANNHCAAGENKLSPGHWYVQPSPYDGTPVKLGELKRFVEIKFDEFTCPYRQFVMRTLNPIKQVKGNEVDLAIVSVDEDDILPEILNIGRVKGKRRGIPGEEMEKMGRTTGHTTEGTLIDNNYFGNIKYSRGKVAFGPVGLIRANGFSAGGDSSSAILFSEDKYFAGLLFAGSATHTIFCHYDRIEELGDVEVYVGS